MEYLKKIPRQSADYQLQQIDDEILLYSHLYTKTVYLNSSSALVWRLCDGNKSIESIIEQINELYPQYQSKIKSDVIKTINDLSDNDALLF